MTRRLVLILAAFMVITLIVNAIGLTAVLQSSSGVSTLLTNGKTTSAITAKQTKAEVSKAAGIVTKVESQLQSILAKSDANRQLVCSVAAEVHISSDVIAKDCAGYLPPSG